MYCVLGSCWVKQGPLCCLVAGQGKGVACFGHTARCIKPHIRLGYSVGSSYSVLGCVRLN